MTADRVAQLAGEYGFEVAGVAAAAPAPEAGYFLDWVAAGRAGSMRYLTDHRADMRADPRALLPEVKSVLCVGKVYNDGRAAGADGISRYARSEDYHGVMRRGLEALVERLKREIGGFEYRICVDTAPLLERSYARQAGLGWIGKNTCIINQRLGSWLFLGEVLLGVELEAGAPAADRCGSCTRCIEACPTEALVEDSGAPGGWALDARRCISYLTIEHKGPIAEELREGVGGLTFGCDICQDVCPWNRRAAVTSDPAFASSVAEATIMALARLTSEEFRDRYRHTPVWRAKHSRFLRNVAVVMGNSGDVATRVPLESLAASPDPLVAEHARWALTRLDQSDETSSAAVDHGAARPGAGD